MKTLQTTPTPTIDILTEEKKVEIIATINANWDEFYTASELAHFIEQGYIFGPLGESEHFKIDDIMALINEVELEKNPLPIIEETPVVEPIVEEPIITQ